MSEMFPFPTNMISKRFRWFAWLGAFGRFCMILLAYIVLLNTRTAQGLISHENVFILMGLGSTFYVVYMGVELIRPNNLSFWIITVSADKDTSEVQ